ncbi:MAG: hypothetical protein N2321_06155 [Melioribacteraceae bacterium]|nr:hypothetical protein [Melioribacteraceae bacterium]
MKKFLFFITINFVITSCDDTVTNQEIDKIIIPASNVKFSEHIYPVLRVKCNTATCHNSRDRAGNLSLDSYSDVVSDPLIVFPGLPQNSKLVWAIEGRVISPMPPIGYPPLTKNQIDGIKNWIKEGAKNN